MQRPLRIDLVGEGERRSLRLSWGEDTTVLDGAAVGELIEKLALYRAAMRPPVRSTLLPGHRYHMTVDPSWYAEPSQLLDATVLFFRHEGLGWTGFALENEQCRRWLGELRAAARSVEGKDRKGARPC
ncbi:hypothetical protein WJ542_21160 [Paraburkholderia sp. B3]|uniref:hypothetical protein n=1 Tax=Paraburkholderia sp. B3 TaxID=3134791 RepID=UPI0039819D76